MDSFRGSRQPTFLSFFLDNQTTEGDTIPTEPQVNLPIVAGDQNVEVHEQRLILSPPVWRLNRMLLLMQSLSAANRGGPTVLTSK